MVRNVKGKLGVLIQLVVTTLNLESQVSQENKQLGETDWSLNNANRPEMDFVSKISEVVTTVFITTLRLPQRKLTKVLERERVSEVICGLEVQRIAKQIPLSSGTWSRSPTRVVSTPFHLVFPTDIF